MGQQASTGDVNTTGGRPPTSATARDVYITFLSQGIIQRKDGTRSHGADVPRSGSAHPTCSGRGEREPSTSQPWESDTTINQTHLPQAEWVQD